MASNNAFWREVIDYLPNLVLVFRVDEKENAQLIFCNNKIRDELGYSAREFVLASESDGPLKQELDDLVEEVARRSHDVDDIVPRPCPLTHKQGAKKYYDIDFRLFKTKKWQAQLIAVELRKTKQRSGDGEQASESKRSQKVEDSPLFVCQSGIMKSLLKTIERIERESKRHILFQGEEGVGKRTLADRLIQRQIEEHEEWEQLDAGNDGKFLSKERIENCFNEVHNLIVRIPHISNLNSDRQQLLLQLLTERNDRELVTWIIATTTRNLEEQVRQDRFQADLYYQIGFETLLIPPLRQRREDIRAAAREYVRRAGRVLNLDIQRIDEEALDRLEEQEWDDNFPQLFKVLRRSLLESERGEFQLLLKQKQQYQLFPEQKISEDAVLSFDQMNRKYLKRVLELTDGKIYGDDGAAALLDLKPTTLQSKLKRLGIK